MINSTSEISEDLIAPILKNAPEHQESPRPEKERLQSLDVLRGLTIALMILVDFCGDTTPDIDHSPWDGMTLADTVVPLFDFMVGVSIVISMQSGRLNAASTSSQLRASFTRALKLFVLGMLTQAGTPFPTYDLKHLRIMGILQRVACCYLVCSWSEILLKRSNDRPAVLTSQDVLTPLSRGIVEGTVKGDTVWERISRVHKNRIPHYGVMIMLCLLHTLVIFTTDQGEGCTRGDTSPNCNAASIVDQMIFGKDHMYFPTNGGAYIDKGMTFQRTEACSGCSPGWCIPHGYAPSYCGYNSLEGGRAFDPEGFVSTLTCVCAALFGASIGAMVVAHRGETKDRLTAWLVASVVQLMLGGVCWGAGIKINPNLYSLSFLFVTNGICGLMLSVISFAIDGAAPTTADAWGSPATLVATPFRWLGMNSILMYMLSCTDIVPWALSLFYWDNTNNSLYNVLFPTGVWWSIDMSVGYLPAQATYPSEYDSMYVLLWCILAYIPFWVIVAGFLHRKKYYFKV